MHVIVTALDSLLEEILVNLITFCKVATAKTVNITTGNVGSLKFKMTYTKKIDDLQKIIIWNLNLFY